jgi:carboxyl-terminal processing protease
MHKKIKATNGKARILFKLLMHTGIVLYHLFFFAACKQSKEQLASNRFASTRPLNSSLTMPDSVYGYLQEVLDSIQHYSIYKKQIDWNEYRKSFIQDAKGAQSYAETYFAIEEALRRLGDRHSFLKSPDDDMQWRAAVQDKRFEFKRTHGVMRDGIAHIYVPAFTSGNPEACLQYATGLQEIIKKLDAMKPIGWIVGLDYNYGGNMWPMLAGIGPLLVREGVQGNFLDADGRKTPWIYENGTAKAGKEILLMIANPYKIRNKQVPIAINISERTASSGEAILISFLGQPNVRVFGTPTAGLSTANGDYPLKDGARLILTSAVFTDAAGKVYGKKIPPHVDLSDDLFYRLTNRLRAPTKWILSRHRPKPDS